jgi:AcrR family transcriptional regulator
MSVKEKTKAEFLISAKAIFMEKGIAETYMDDIAVRSGKTRRTIYRHFDTKEDLAYEVLIGILEEWNEYQRQIFQALTGTGIVQLSAFLHGIKTYMSDRIALMAFLAEFDFYFKDTKDKKIKPELLERFDVNARESDGLIERLIDMGLEDQTISINKDKHLIIATISSVLWGFGQRVAVRGKTMTMELNQDPIDIFSCQIDIYIDFLRKEA